MYTNLTKPMDNIDSDHLRKRKIVDSHVEDDNVKISKQNENSRKNTLEGKSMLECYVERFFPNSSQRLKAFIVRTILTVILLILIPTLLFGDFLIDFLIILVIIIQCYREYIRVGYMEYRIHKLPLIRSLAYYILFSNFYFLLGEFPITYLSTVIPENVYLFLTVYHNFINFCIFMFGFVLFVLTLKKRYYKIQFALYGWCLLGSSLWGYCARCLFQNMKMGIIWAILPMMLIVMNDTFAYVVGITIGKTPLIKLSPKKTWEGFIGGGIITYIGGLVLCWLMTRFPYFYCPYRFNPGCHTFNITCKLPYFMEPRVYQFPAIATLILPERISSFQYYPIYFHVLAISTFCSILAPFGGFFASGFKRAFKIKDFGGAFPGHGGMLDRMDCQILLTIFVYVYTNTFVRFDQQQKIFNQILKLSPERQFELYEMLKNTLTKYGSLPT